MFERLIETAGPGTPLAVRGRRLDARLVLRAGTHDTMVTINQGAVTAVQNGPFVMPAFDLRIAADAADWAAFLAPAPAPGAHDIMALLRRGRMQFEGNLQPLMANLLYFKLMLASLRPATGVTA